jgi:hypothetical protein
MDNKSIIQKIKISLQHNLGENILTGKGIISFFKSEILLVLNRFEFKLLGFCVLTFLILYSPLNEIFNNVILIPILSKINQSYRIDFSIIIISLIFIYSSCQRFKNKKRINTSLIFFIIIVITSYNRILSQNLYSFIHFKINILSNYKYFDALYLIGVLYLVEFFWGLGIKYSKPYFDDNSFLIDNPINESKLDKYGRKMFAKRIAEKIKSQNKSNSSVAIGIEGLWGSGKTSFLKMIKEFLHTEEGDKSRIIIDFHPWKSTSPNQINEDFFSVFKEEISKISPSISLRLNKYAKSLKDFNENLFIKLINVLTELINENGSKETYFNNLNSELEKLEKQIIIFIDDIDRLDKKEVIEVIKLIRNTANFKNTIFIVSYERNYLITAIGEMNKTNNREYLEKIFQFEFSLPPFENSIIQKEILNYILPKLNTEHRINFQDIVESHTQIDGLLFEHIKTKRDAIRFINQFLFDYEGISEEIEIKDFTIFQILKLKFPDAIEYMYRNRKKLFEVGDHHLIIHTKKYNIETNNNSIQDAFLEKLKLSNLGNVYKISDLKNIAKILSFLFDSQYSFNYDLEINAKSISIVSNYYKYFANRVFEGEISIKEFNFSYLKNEDDFLFDISKWLRSGYENDIFKMLTRIDLNKLTEVQEYEKIVKSAFLLTKNDFYEPLWIYQLLQQSEKSYLITEVYKSNKVEHQNFIRSLFVNASTPFKFESRIISTILFKFDGYFVLEKSELVKINIDYVRKYIKEITDINDRTLWDLIYNNKLPKEVLFPSNGKGIKSVANPEVSEIVLKYVNSNKQHALFLSNFIRIDHISESIKYCLSWDVINAIFGDEEEFENYISNFEKEYEDIFAEFNQFYEGNKSIQYQNYIEFRFNKIKPPIKAK